jgi:signal transduction histidine kinase/DNA-binding response OmpR family regulator
MPTGERAANLWLRFAHLFIPEQVRADPAAYRVSRIAIGIFVATIFAGVGFGLIHWATLPPPIDRVIGPTILGCAVAGALGPLVLRARGASFATQAVLAYCFAALSVLVFFLGGPDSPQLYWLIAIPVPAIMAFGQRGAWWLAAVLAESLVLYALHLGGFQFPAHLTPELARAKWLATSIGFTVYFTAQFSVFSAVQANATRALRRIGAEVDAARAEAEAANRAKSSFIANVSHKLRTPMTSVLGYTQLLRMDGGALPTPEVQGLVATIERNGRHLLAIVDDILDLSKLEAGQIDVCPEPVVLDELLWDVTSSMESRARARGLELAQECESEVPWRIETDPLRLRQVLFNLIGNAIKFTPEGRVTLRVTAGEPGRIRFSVDDTGIGMTPEQAERLFQPFAQADASTTRLYGGTGLGLSICKRFVELMGGRIWVETQPGAGSHFRFELPVGDPDRATRATHDTTPRRSRRDVPGRRIVLGEPDSDHRELLVELLRAAGAEVEALQDPTRALDTARAAELAGRSYDAAVVDVPLDALRDPRALSDLRARAPGTRVVAVSAGAFREDRARCLAAGFDAYVTKPVDLDELVAALSRPRTQVPAASAAEIDAGAPGVAQAAPVPSRLDRLLFPDETVAPARTRGMTARLALAVYFTLVTALACVTGGALSAPGYWLFAMPVAAVSLIGTRGAVVCAGLAIAEFVCFFALARRGMSFPNWLAGEPHVAASVAGFVAMALLAVGFAHRFMRHTNETLDRLAASIAELARARDSADQASSSKTQFIANISHEIRTPMTAILGFAELLAESVADAPGERPSRALAAIRRNGARLLHIVDDLLDLSKIDAGRFRLERLAVSPQSIVASVVESLRDRALSERLTLDASAEGALPVRIWTDGARLRRALWVLVENALGATRAGGVQVVSRVRDDHWVLEVRDTGPGIPRYSLEAIRHLWQSGAGAAGADREIGLGLALCGRLASLLDGSLEVESEPGRGSVFRLAVPTDSDGEVTLPAGEDLQPDAAPVASVRAGTRVLLADDGPDNRKLIALLLNREGAAVTLASNGREAVELASSAAADGQPFHVVLMDMHMPIFDGYEATRRLRADGYPGAIVALTAQDLDEARAECLAAGCDDFLPKPVARDRLVAAVARWAAVKTPGAKGDIS